MKKFTSSSSSSLSILILVLVSFIFDQTICSYGGHGGGHGGGDYGKHDDGYSKHKPHPYKFGYEIEDGYGGKNSRHESGDDYGNVHGSYSLHDKDGRKRIVEYVADKKGFRAKIHSNEPGLTSHNAAHAYYDVENHGYHGGGGDYGHDSNGYGDGGFGAGKKTGYGDDDGYGYQHEEKHY